MRKGFDREPSLKPGESELDALLGTRVPRSELGDALLFRARLARGSVARDLEGLKLGPHVGHPLDAFLLRLVGVLRHHVGVIRHVVGLHLPEPLVEALC